MIGAAKPPEPITPDTCQCCGSVNPQFPTATSPFCVRCAERKRCPTQSPLSGYEPLYMPRLYNAKKYTQHNHNCFAYAFDIMDLPTAEECNGNDEEDCKVPFHQPGYFSGQKRFDESGEKRCFDLFTRLKSDMPAIEIARGGRPIRFTDRPAKGYSKIALVIDPKQDYHFYRQDSNGFWSHKPGGTPVTNKDSAGRLIYNPELANRDNREDGSNADGLNYNVFCGFMCVPRTLPNRAKRGGGKGKRAIKTRRLLGGMNSVGNTTRKSANDMLVVRKMMAIVHKLKSKYPDVVLTKDDEKKFRDIARASTLPKYSPGSLFGIIQKKYGAAAPEVRTIFRNAEFLPAHGATRPTMVAVKRRTSRRPARVNENSNTNRATLKAKMAANRATRAERRAASAASALYAAAHKPRNSRAMTNNTAITAATSAVLDKIRNTGASESQIEAAIDLAKDHAVSSNVNVPDPLVDALADLFSVSKIHNSNTSHNNNNDPLVKALERMGL